MDEKTLRKKCMGIVNQLYDLAEVSVDKRQSINDTADEYMVNTLKEIMEQSVISAYKDGFNAATNALITTNEFIQKN